MSKTKKSSSAGGGGGQQLQDAARITKAAPRRENGITQFAAVFNGVTETTTTSTGAVSGSFANIAQRERTTLGVSVDTMSNSSRPSPTCNSPTVQDRKPHLSAGARADGGGATACTAACSCGAVGGLNRQPPEFEEGLVQLRRNGDGTLAKFTDTRTTPIIHLLFYRTFIQANLDKDVIRRFDIEPVFKKLSDKERSFVQDTCEKYLEYLGSSEKVSVDSHRRALETAGWEVSDNNVDAEFKKVVNQTFDENVTWGNVIGFLGFALGFSIFIHNKGMKRAVVSVAEWTKQVIEDDIGRFFLEHNGWVSYPERERERERERKNGCCVCTFVCASIRVYVYVYVTYTYITETSNNYLCPTSCNLPQ